MSVIHIEDKGCPGQPLHFESRTKHLRFADENNPATCKLCLAMVKRREKALGLGAAGIAAGMQLFYKPPEDSHYTGMLSGIYYVNGNQVSEAEFRNNAVNLALKRAKELKEEQQ